MPPSQRPQQAANMARKARQTPARGSQAKGPKCKVEEDINTLTTRLGGISTQPIESKPNPNPNRTEGSAASPATAPPPCSATTTAQSRREALPLPTPFDGDRTLYRSWRLSMELKLKADDELIGDNQNKCYVIFMSLAPNVQRVVSGFFVGGDMFNYDPERFFAKLDLLYEDPVLEQRALLQLMNLRQQPKERFHDFLVRFEELLGRAGGEDWPETQKIIHLGEGLNERMEELCHERGWPEEEEGYEMAIQYFRQLDFGLEIVEIRDGGEESE
ncbi:hypothetical protein E4U39_001082 [Claviceps sp. Clav50 group G5]|nr:hypothetical protein E4U39_001082 [Claviceps sp. Clav50 group G5]